MNDVLLVAETVRERMVSHAREGRPAEVCGILAGRNGQASHIFPLRNADASPTSYFADPREQIHTMKHLRKEGLEMIGIYHSHPASEAYPSKKDIECALYPVFYIIVSLQDPDQPSIRAFRIERGNVKEVQIEYT